MNAIATPTFSRLSFTGHAATLGSRASARTQLDLFGARDASRAAAPQSAAPSAAAPSAVSLAPSRGSERSERVKTRALGRSLTPNAAHVLPGDTFKGREIFAGARAWHGDLNASAFVRVEKLDAGRYLASALCFDGEGFGQVTHTAGGEADVFLFLRRALAKREAIFVLGAELRLVQRSLPAGAAILDRRSALSLRVHEVGILGAIRDEGQRLAMRSRRDKAGRDDDAGHRWRCDQARSELVSLAALGPCRPTFH